MAAERFPGRIALKDETACISYAELAARIASCIDCLTTLGVHRGDRVAVMTPAACDAFILFLSLNAIGAVWTGINPRFTSREGLYVIADSLATVIVVADNLLPLNADWLTAGVLTRTSPQVRHVMPLSAIVPDGSAGDAKKFDAVSAVATAGADDIAALVYTSGSSGSPKGCMLSNRSIIGRNLVFNRRFPVVDYPRMCSVMPMNHIAGTTMIPSAVLMAEGTIIFRRQFDPGEVGRLIEENSLNIYFGAPAMFQLVFRSPSFKTEQFHSLEWLIFGGAPMSLDSVANLKRLCNRVVASWGMTETMGPTTFTGPNATEVELSRSIGKAAIDGDVKLVGDDGVQCTEGEIGEILVRRTYCMSGYFNRDEETAKAFTADGWFRTGDLAELLDSGSLRFVGRISDMFKSGGYNVYPREIEMVIERHPGVALAAVIAVHDEIWGEVGHAFVVSKQGMHLTKDEVRAWCKERLANYKMPKVFDIRESVPMLPAGKVDKVSLREAVSGAGSAKQS